MAKEYARLDAIDRQVFICFDGEDGLVIQTDISTYESYYRHLGWELMGRAQPFPEIADIKPLNRQKRLI